MNSSISLPKVDALIRTLDLRPHPEGGYFRATYRTAPRIPGERPASTLIYFLLPHGHVSRLHRIDADESWHLYLGGPLEIFELDERDPAAAPSVTALGTRLDRVERRQHVVPAGRWFGGAPAAGARYALVGCGVAPGFEFSTVELAERAALLEKFPSARDPVLRLT